MVSSYSPSLKLELMATGDQSGTWGDTTNTNLGTLLEQAITGYIAVAQGDVANKTLTSLNGASDEARNMVVEVTGAMTAARNVVVPTAEKIYLIKNSTTGGFALTVKTTAGTGITVPATTARWVYCDGTNVVDGQSGPWAPSSNDAQALGLSGTAWADLFLASGGVVNWNAGNYTLTHSAGVLTASGTVASTGSSVGYTAFQAISTEAAAAAGPIIEIYRNSASPVATDVLGQVLFNGKDSAGNVQEYASIQAAVVSPTSTTEASTLDTYVQVGGVRTLGLSIGQYLGLPTATAPTPTVDGAVGWDSDDNALVVGDGAGQKIFRPNAWELISTQTPSAVAAITWTGLGAYRKLRITGFLRPATDGVALYLRTSSNNGTSYDSGAGGYSYQYIRGALTTAAAGNGTDTGFALYLTNIGSDTSEGCQFEAVLDQFNQATSGWCKADIFQFDVSANPLTGMISGLRLDSTARNAIQLIFGSGNITSGQVTLEGLRG